jgi:proteasome lid subunit RPN8/RPN11
MRMPNVRLPASIRDAVIDHALGERPNEACGVVVGDGPGAGDGRPVRFVPTRNALASPYRYEVHPDDLISLVFGTERAGESFWAIVHSHLRTEPVPSPTDLARAAYPEALHLIVSLRRCRPASDGRVEAGDRERAEIALWRIADGSASPVPLAVDR